MLRELMNQLWPTERLKSLRARAGRIAAFRLFWPGCSGFEDLGDTFPRLSNTLDALRRSADCPLEV